MRTKPARLHYGSALQRVGRPVSARRTFDDAVSRLRTAVESGAEGGQIRDDVATDLLNLIGPLENADIKDVDGRVSVLRRKIAGRTAEGSMSSAQAAILRARLADVDRAAGM